MLKRWLQDLVYLLITPITSLLVKLNISPNALTMLGLVANVLATWFFIKAGMDFTHDGYWLILAATAVLVGGLFDILDGRIARLSGKQHKPGALFDSVIDRYAELFMFLGMGWYLINLQFTLGLLACFMALSGSLMVSYARARVEGLGGSCEIGIMQRPERIVLFSLGVLVFGLNRGYEPSPVDLTTASNSAGSVDWLVSLTESFKLLQIESELWILFVPLAIIAVFANITAIRRLIHGYNILKEQE